MIKPSMLYWTNTKEDNYEKSFCCNDLPYFNRNNVHILSEYKPMDFSPSLYMSDSAAEDIAATDEHEATTISALRQHGSINNFPKAQFWT